MRATAFGQSGPTIDTVAGTGNSGFSGDGGSALLADIGYLGGIAVDGEGNFFFSDNDSSGSYLPYLSSRIRRVDASTGIITTVVGGGSIAYPNDGILATDAFIGTTSYVAVDRYGDIYFDENYIDAYNPGFGFYFTDPLTQFENGESLNGSARSARIRRLDAATGVLSTIAGGGNPTETISYVIDPGSLVPVTANWPLPSGDGGIATSAFLSQVRDIALDSAGNVYFVDAFQVRRVDAATGIVTTVAGNGQIQLFKDAGAGIDLTNTIPGGAFYIGAIEGIDSGDGGPATNAGLVLPQGLAIDAAGNLFIGESDDYLETGIRYVRVRRVDGATGIITTVAGSGENPYSAGVYGGDGGPAIDATFGSPLGVSVDASGNLYIVDGDFNAIRRVDASTGIITTVAGNGSTMEGFAGDGGPAILASLAYPLNSAFDSTGNLYVIDHDNSRVRKIAGLSNAPPTAVAGPDQSMHAGSTVLLDGSGSFDDNTPTTSLGYVWGFVSRPAGSTASLNGIATATPSFVADLPGTYVVALVVTDQEGLTSASDQIDISSTNLPPTANAGLDQGGVVDQTVHLNGAASVDPEMDPLTYSWAFSTAPVGNTAILIGSSTATPSFAPNVAGSYVVDLVVDDGFASSAVDEVVVTVVTGQQFAENATTTAINTVASLPLSSVSSQGNQKSMTQSLAVATKDLQSGKVALARAELQKSIERTDGWALRGAADNSGPSRDWVTDRDASIALYNQLVAALNALN
jgi:hypothetical protein